MPFNNEIEKTKKEIEVLTAKLSFLEEMENHKTSCEIAYKDWWGEYPETGTWDSFDYTRWAGFQAGYKSAQKDYKVGEFQEPAPEEGHKTLYDILRELDKPMFIDDVCSAVKKWMFQYNCDYANCREYLEGYEECQTVLEERIK